MEDLRVRDLSKQLGIYPYRYLLHMLRQKDWIGDKKFPKPLIPFKEPERVHNKLLELFDKLPLSLDDSVEGYPSVLYNMDSIEVKIFLQEDLYQAIDSDPYASTQSFMPYLDTFHQMSLPYQEKLQDRYGYAIFKKFGSSWNSTVSLSDFAPIVARELFLPPIFSTGSQREKDLMVYHFGIIMMGLNRKVNPNIEFDWKDPRIQTIWTKFGQFIKDHVSLKTGRFTPSSPEKYIGEDELIKMFIRPVEDIIKGKVVKKNTEIISKSPSKGKKTPSPMSRASQKLSEQEIRNLVPFLGDSPAWDFITVDEHTETLLNKGGYFRDGTKKFRTGNASGGKFDQQSSSNAEAMHLENRAEEFQREAERLFEEGNQQEAAVFAGNAASMLDNAQSIRDKGTKKKRGASPSVSNSKKPRAPKRKMMKGPILNKAEHRGVKPMKFSVVERVITKSSKSLPKAKKPKKKTLRADPGDREITAFKTRAGKQVAFPTKKKASGGVKKPRAKNIKLDKEDRDRNRQIRKTLKRVEKANLATKVPKYLSEVKGKEWVPVNTFDSLLEVRKDRMKKRGETGKKFPKRQGETKEEYAFRLGKKYGGKGGTRMKAKLIAEIQAHGISRISSIAKRALGDKTIQVGYAQALLDILEKRKIARRKRIDRGVNQKEITSIRKKDAIEAHQIVARANRLISKKIFKLNARDIYPGKEGMHPDRLKFKSHRMGKGQGTLKDAYIQKYGKNDRKINDFLSWKEFSAKKRQSKKLSKGLY